MAHARRRVSYVIPPPVDSVPRLQLPPFGVPRLGSTGPLLIPSQIVVQDTGEGSPKRTGTRRPRHRLGVASLAIDTSTQLSGRNAPEGILYTGGRDGLVMSWDLGIPMKRKPAPSADGDSVYTRDHRAVGRWEVLTGWADDIVDDESEDLDERPTLDGDVLGDVSPVSSRRKWAARWKVDRLPEDQWETDLEAFKPGNVCVLLSSCRVLSMTPP
jgi:WD repeat-containing protein 48